MNQKQYTNYSINILPESNIQVQQKILWACSPNSERLYKSWNSCTSAVDMLFGAVDELPEFLTNETPLLFIQELD